MQNKLYNKITFENLMKRALKHVPDDIDKREGSVIYDTIAAVVVELAQEYIELDNILELGFVQTSNGEWLTKKCSELGVNRKMAVHAERKGIFNVEIPIGARFSIDDLVYTNTAPINISGADKEYKLRAETAGEIGNKPFGALMPITYINGLEKAELAEIITAGENEESDEKLLKRYLDTANKPSFGGNKQQYISFVEEIDGVGHVKCFPLWNGRGTVRIVAVAPDKQALSSEKVTEIQNIIDPKKDGMGDGYAPIGHIVTVETANVLNIDVAVDVNLKVDIDIEDVKAELQTKLEKYLQEKSFEETVIRLNSIGGLVIETDEILDYQNLKLNGNTKNVIVDEDVIIKLGTLTVNQY
ncbi:baseplate J/gp47 family protein [Abyssisolibacter fermentans]|uniref:baseplate J/gp47 family protein n=1 Tax=Abyssisolibacter fermentans TaxID=1766203 RepID=UPI0008296744|nr:baseplate J/gp47 family protein [Abyssisolibacter fermentans]